MKNKTTKKTKFLRTLSFLMALIMVLTAFPLAASAANPPAFINGGQALPAPEKGLAFVKSYDYDSNDISLFFYVPEWLQNIWKEKESLGEFAFGNKYGLGDGGWSYLDVWYQVDCKVDNGNWQYYNGWDKNEYSYYVGENSVDTYCLSSYSNTGDTYQSLSNEYYLGNETIQNVMSGAYVPFIDNEGDTEYQYDLANHTIYFRIRFNVFYRTATGNYDNVSEDMYVQSPWSATWSVGKNSNQTVPAKPVSLEAPVLSGFSFNAESTDFILGTPDSVFDAQMYCDVFSDGYIHTEYEENINDTGWKEAYSWNSGISSSSKWIQFTQDVNQTDYIRIRGRYVFEPGDGEPVYSAWSNVLKINAPVIRLDTPYVVWDNDPDVKKVTWAPIAHANKYTVQVVCGTSVLKTCDVTTAAYDATEDIKAPGTYNIIVTAKDTTGEYTESLTGSSTDRVFHTHTYDRQVQNSEYLKTDYTCTTNAFYYKSCSCGRSSKGQTDEAFEAAGTARHNYLEYRGFDSTGHWSKCSACGKDDKTTLKPHTPGAAATCAAAQCCTDCGYVIAPATGLHVYSKETVSNEFVKEAATCLTDAVYYKACNVCSKSSEGTENAPTFVKAGSALGHRFSNDSTVWEGRDAAGHYHICKRPGCAVKDVTVPHTPNIAKASCTQKQYCTVCQYEISDIIDHSYTVENDGAMYLKSAATCTKNAVYYKSCTCGKSSKGTAGEVTFEKKNSLLGHDWSKAWTADKKASLTADGSKSHHCSRCNAKKSVTAVARIKSVKLSKTTLAYNGKVQKPTVTVKDSKGNVISSSYYTVKYSSGCKSIGTYTATVTFKGLYTGKKTLSFKIVPAKPTKLKANQTTTSVTLTWSKAAGAAKYEVFLYNADGKLLKKTTVTGTSASFKKLSSGTVYRFKVRAVDRSGKYFSLYSSTLTAATQPKSPTIKVTSPSKAKATVSWSKVKGATSYTVYYSTSKTKGFKKLADTSKTSLTASKLTSGKTYYFKAVANKKVETVTVKSAYSSVKYVKVK